MSDIPLPWDETGLFVVFDYEASGLHPDDGARPSTLGLQWDDNQTAIIPIDQGTLDKPGSKPTLFGDADNVDIETWQHVHHWMANQHLIAHGAKADLWFAWAGLRPYPDIRYDLTQAFHWDTLVTEALLEPGIRVSLDMVAERYGWNEPHRNADTAMRNWAKKTKSTEKSATTSPPGTSSNPTSEPTSTEPGSSTTNRKNK